MKFRVLSVLLLVLLGCNQEPDVPGPVNNGLTVYPNPTLGLVSITFDNVEGHDYTVMAFGTKGEVLLEKKENTTKPTYTLDLSGKPQGIYHIVLEKDNQTLTRRLLKY